MKKIIAAVIVFTILCATVVLLFSEALQLPPHPPPPPFEHDYKSQVCAEQVAETAKVTSMLNAITDKLNNLISNETKGDTCQICPTCPEVPKTECDPCPQCPTTTTNVVGNFDSIFAAAQSLWKYENPIMNRNRANSIASKFAKLPDKAINFHEEDQKTFFQKNLKKYVDERNSLLGTYPFKDNFMYGAIDDTLLYSITRWTKPKKVIEIGSGWSTSTLNRALQKNGEEGKKGQHICIEPYRAEDIKVTDITIIKKPLEEVDLDMFSTLEAGDILFIDSSHVVVPYSDVVLEYAFILPILAKGVIVHIHDIFLPFDYPVEWMFGDIPRTYDEQWILAAMLSAGNNWNILFSTFYMTRTNPDLFADFPKSGIPVPPDSFWMVRS